MATESPQMENGASYGAMDGGREDLEEEVMQLKDTLKQRQNHHKVEIEELKSLMEDKDEEIKRLKEDQTSLLRMVDKSKKHTGQWTANLKAKEDEAIAWKTRHDSLSAEFSLFKKDFDEKVHRLAVVEEKAKRRDQTLELLQASLEKNQAEAQTWKKFAIDLKRSQWQALFEKHKLQIQIMGEALKNECNRFEGNAQVLADLSLYCQRMKEGTEHYQSQKKRVSDLVKAVNQDVSEGCFSVEIGSFPNIELLPLPNVYHFYQRILDKIPTVFFKDLDVLKTIAPMYIKGQLKANSQGAAAPGLREQADYRPIIKPVDKGVEDIKGSLESIPITSTAGVIARPSKPSIPSLSQTSSVPTPSIGDALPPSSIGTNSMTAESLRSIWKPLQTVTPVVLPSTTAQASAPTLASASVSAAAPVVCSSPSFSSAIRSNPAAVLPIGTAPVAISGDVNMSMTRGYAAKESDKPKTTGRNFDKLIIKLRDSFPHLSDESLATHTMEYRQLKGSFSGIPVAEVVNRIRDYIQQELQNRSGMRVNSSSNGIKMGLPPALAQTHNPWGPSGGSKTGTDIDRQCAVCMETMHPYNFEKTECGHNFHAMCIKSWVQRNNSCPICRALLLPPDDYPTL